MSSIRRVFASFIFVVWLTSSAFSAHPLIPSDYPAVSASRLTEGVIMADKFRRELLLRGESGQRPIDVIARACVEFRGLMAHRADDLIALKSFRIKEKQLTKAIEGERGYRRWGRTFERFGGKWYGKWDQMEVDHRWHETVEFETPLKVEGFYDVFLKTGQFAWVGDGFGWNLVATEDVESRKAFVLGTVYHVEEGDTSRVTNHRPHVGIICSKSQIIWITRGEIFFEEFFDGKSDEEERYAITGFRYRFNGRNVSNVGNAFQAIYTRNPQSRPEWKQFHLGISVQ